MKKFLLFTLEFPPVIGGVSNYYHNMTRYWGIDGIDILCHKKRGGKSREFKNGHIYYRRLICKLLRPRWLPSLFHLALTIKRRKTEHVIVGHILPLGLVTLRLSKWLGFSYSVILHGMDLNFALKTRTKKKKTLIILKGAEKIICANSYTAKIVSGLKSEFEKKTAVVNPGIKISLDSDHKKAEDLKRKYGLGGQIIIFCLGRLVKRKGFDKMILSIPRLIEQNSDISLVIAGDGPDRAYLEKKIQTLPSNKIRKKIILRGEISREESWAWMEACDIFAMPSREIDGDFEGFGIVYLEANLAGKPVIAGDSGGVRDAVIDGVNGLLTDPYDIMDIVRKTAKLVNDKKLRGELGERGRQRAINEFNWKKQADKIKQALDS